MEVLQEQHQAVGGHRLQRLGRLPQHPLPGPAERPPFQVLRPAGSTRAGSWTSQVGARRDSTATASGSARQSRPRASNTGRYGSGAPRCSRHWPRATSPALPSTPAANASTSVDLPMPASPVTNTTSAAARPRPGCTAPAAAPAPPPARPVPPPRPPRSRRRGRLLDRAQELVAAAVDGADHPLGPAVVADRPAGRLDPAGQRRVGHEAAAPDLVQQLGPGDDPVAVADQVGEDLEHLRLQVAGTPPRRST